MYHVKQSRGAVEILGNHYLAAGPHFHAYVVLSQKLSLLVFHILAIVTA